MDSAKITIACLIALCFVFVSACDDDGNGSLTSVDNSKSVADLSQAELEQMCEDYTDALLSRLDEKTICKFVAIAVGDEVPVMAEETCKAAYDTCRESDLDLESELGFDLDDLVPCDEIIGDSSNTENCTSTVGEVDACIQDTLKIVDDVLDSLSCGDTSLGDLEELLDFDDPESCEALDDQCFDPGDIEIPI